MLPSASITRSDADGAGDRAGLMVHAMRVDRDRTADRKDVGRLHGLHRKARMQLVLDVVPDGAGLHRHGAGVRVDLDLVELAHVEHQRIVVEGVAAHRMADRRDRHFQPVGARECQRLGDMRLLAHLDDAVDRRCRQRAGVVDHAALRQPGQRRDRMPDGCLQRLQRQRLAVDVGDAAGALRPRRVARQPRQRRPAPQHPAADQCRAEQQTPRNAFAPFRHLPTPALVILGLDPGAARDYAAFPADIVRLPDLAHQRSSRQQRHHVGDDRLDMHLVVERRRDARQFEEILRHRQQQESVAALERDARRLARPGFAQPLQRLGEPARDQRPRGARIVGAEFIGLVEAGDAALDLFQPARSEHVAEEFRDRPGAPRLPPASPETGRSFRTPRPRP